jgi:hypothetical protein
VVVVPVVDVLAVLVLVRERFVLVHVAVRARRHRIVDVRVMAVVVGVQVLVAHRLVAVVMAVVFGRVQPDAHDHQQRRDGERRARPRRAERQRDD